jgi:hypothetical protein
MKTGQIFAAVAIVLVVFAAGLFVYEKVHAPVTPEPVGVTPVQPDCTVPGNCPSATTTSTTTLPIPATQTGTLAGTMTIGPNCPVEQVNHPCLPTPEAYASHKVYIYTSAHTLVKTLTPDSTGHFGSVLPAGTYVVDVAHQAVGGVRGAPQTVIIAAGKTASISIDIDTGIR